MKRIMIIICLLNTFVAMAQKPGYAERANAYIQQYSAWAIEEQQRSGIPASITLAQGIYETGAGESELATQANNHFGIKCKKEWKGETFAHTDDAPNECFRKYGCAKDSYKDHSDYLKSSARYAALFKLDPTNYTAWATGLKRCGYATNPAYAQKLIKMVEDFELQQFTLAALNQRPDEVIPMRDNIAREAVYTTTAPTTETKITEASDQAQQLLQSGDGDGVRLVNGIRAIYCHKGDNLLEKAILYKIRYARLLEINELQDAPLPRDMYVYLEKKNFKGAHATYTVKEGETIEYIAHEEGMGSRQLRIFNLMAQNEQPEPGAVMKLQDQAEVRPPVYVISKTEHPGTGSSTGTIRLADPGAGPNDRDYLPTHRPQPVPPPQQSETVEIGYGAERPSATEAEPRTVVTTPEPQIAVVPAAVSIPVPQEVTKPQEQVQPPQQTPEPAVRNTTPERNDGAAEGQDDLSRLKARLDKVVYARSSSNIKVTRNDEETMGPPAPSSTPPAAQEQATAVYHTVQKGETAYSIAQKYQIRMKQLREWNNLNFESIKTGQKLRVK
jgi:LysM repeat protein